MVIPIELNPVELLEHVTTKQYRPKPCATAVTDGAARGFLTVPVPVALPEPSRPRAALNGYAFSGAGVVEAGGAVCVLGWVDTMGRSRRNFPASREGETLWDDSTGSAERGVWRVESGAPLPGAADRVLPVRDATLIGSGRIRVGRVPACGEGVAVVPTTGTLAAGTPYSARTRAWLLAAGVKEVQVRPPFTVAFGVVGDELTDSLVALDDSGSAGAAGVQADLSGLWLAEETAQLGLVSRPLGIMADDEGEIAAVLRRLRRRDTRVLIIAGGVGDGIQDCTVEAVRRAGGAVRATAVAVGEHWPFLFAKCGGIDVYGLSGDPFRAAACFDLFVRPALLAALGAGAAEWDWTQSSCELPPPPPRSWTIRPARLLGARLRLLPVVAGVPFHPDQTGWIVGKPGEGDGYYRPLSTR